MSWWVSLFWLVRIGSIPSLGCVPYILSTNYFRLFFFCFSNFLENMCWSLLTNHRGCSADLCSSLYYNTSLWPFSWDQHHLSGIFQWPLFLTAWLCVVKNHHFICFQSWTFWLCFWFAIIYFLLWLDYPPLLFFLFSWRYFFLYGRPVMFLQKHILHFTVFQFC